MATSFDSPSELRIVAPRRSIREHVTDIWRYRELLRQLIRKELHVRYQKSVLGFAWSMLNPLFLLVVYSIVFNILGQSFEWFAIWLLSGLLVWNFFATALATGTGSIVNNGYLVSKVNFPREVLPLANIGAALIHLMFSTALMIIVLLVTRFDVDWAYLWLTVPAIITVIVLASALAVLLSAANAYARDTAHLLDLTLLAWFWLTPIVYPFQLLYDKLDGSSLPTWIPLLNPVAPSIIAIQRGVYGNPRVVRSDGTVQQLLPDLSQWWYLRNVGIAFTVACILLAVAIKVFDRAEANFAEVI
ncbi:MAG: ABC transporter permease [Acidimicrobiia bacterium]